jgi:hypothetical protein
MASLYVDGKEYPLRETSQAPVKITRSFSRKLNMAAYGGNQYESGDFFCASTVECEAKDADSVAADVHQFCVDQVLIAAKKYIAEIKGRSKRRKIA